MCKKWNYPSDINNFDIDVRVSNIFDPQTAYVLIAVNTTAMNPFDRLVRRNTLVYTVVSDIRKLLLDLGNAPQNQNT